MNAPGQGRNLLAALSATAQAIGGHRAFATAVNAAMLVFVSYSLAQWTWRFATPTPASAPLAAAPTARQGEFDRRPLQAAQLFGVFRAAGTEKASIAYETLPRTPLNLVLSGIAMRGAASYALISGEGQTESAYGIGEQISPGVMLESIHQDRVVILRGGALETLPLKEVAGFPPGASAAPATTSLAPSSPGGAVLDRDMVKRLLQRPEFLSQATIAPNPGGGFLVSQVQAGSLYERLGLRQGDVIRSVNGQPVNNMEEVMRLYQQLGTATEVNVEVSRGGVSQMLHVDLR